MVESAWGALWSNELGICFCLIVFVGERRHQDEASGFLGRFGPSVRLHFHRALQEKVNVKICARLDGQNFQKFSKMPFYDL